MPTIFDSAFDFMAQIGVFDVLLPFILIYAVVYGLLERVQVFKGAADTKKIHQMVAFVVGFFAVASTEIIGGIGAVTIYATMGLIALTLLSIVVALLGGKGADMTFAFWAVMLAVGVGIIMYLFDLSGFMRIVGASDVLIPMLVVVIVFGLGVKFISTGESAKSEVKEKKDESKPKGEKKPGEKVAEFSEEQLKKPGTIWEDT